MYGIYKAKKVGKMLPLCCTVGFDWVTDLLLMYVFYII